MRIEQDRGAGSTLADLPVLSSRAGRVVLSVLALLSTVVAWGCSGIVSGQNSTAAQTPPQTYSISGTIGPGAAGSGATVTLSGAANATATANSSGNFTFGGLANGTYTITPSRAGYTYSPTSLNVTVSGASITTGLSFTASSLTFSVAGTISPATTGSGATVTLSGAAAASTSADGSGNYTFTGLANGTYAVTPSRTGYTFNPSTQPATVSGVDVTGVNFTATAQTPHSVALTWSGSTSTVSGYNVYRSTVSGAVYAKINASLVAVLNFTDSTVLNSTTYYYVTTAVDSSGNESTFSNEVQAIIP
jgi:hypothetical protein